MKRRNNSIEAFLNSLYKFENKPIPPEIFYDVFEYLEITYKYRVSNVINEGNFINELKPGLIRELVYEILKK